MSLALAARGADHLHAASTSDDLGEYAFAGADMTDFVTQWLERLDDSSSVLLEHAMTDPVHTDRYFYGASFLMADIGPQATSPDAEDDVLRLFAVLAAYKAIGYPGADPSVWDGCDAHVRRAFDHANALGPQWVARWLRQDVIDRGQRPVPPGYAEIKHRRMRRNPAKEAAHEREMASIDQRQLRAANLIDPDGEADFDLQLLTPQP